MKIRFEYESQKSVFELADLNYKNTNISSRWCRFNDQSKLEI